MNREINQRHSYDSIVVGSGPNGLAAAITLAQAGKRTLVLEARDRIGGGARTGEITLPGFRHDLCSAVHPLAAASPFFQQIPLQRYGLNWIFAPAALAHTLDNGAAVLVTTSIEETALSFGIDAAAYQQLFQPLVHHRKAILEDLLGPFPLPPRHPLPTAWFGLLALLPAHGLANLVFRGERARAVFAGMAAHAAVPPRTPATAAFGLMLLMLAHAVGWPIAQGGSQAIVDALAAHLAYLGGEIQVNKPVHDLDELPPSTACLMDLTPRQWISIAGAQMTESYRSALARYRYGPGVFKIDYALDRPIPWEAPECTLAATLHLGGTAQEIEDAEQTVWDGNVAQRPFVLFGQPSLFDPSRAPAGRHTAWAYCHVPNGSTVDMTEAIENQIERFAPGFRKYILARRTWNTAEMEAYNANYVGGDINGGVQDWHQLFTRPLHLIDPYQTPIPGLYLCSSATPPGGGVHGMCGHHAARSALAKFKS